MIKIEEVERYEASDNFRYKTSDIERTVSSCLDDLSTDCSDIYVTSVIDRIEKYDAMYLSEFDKSLNDIINSTGELTTRKVMRVLRNSSKLTSEIYSRMINTLEKIYYDRSNKTA